jgi:hypothetical protein
MKEAGAYQFSMAMSAPIAKASATTNTILPRVRIREVELPY